MPFTAAGASLVAVGLLRVSRLQTKNGGVLGGFRDLCPLPFQAQGARARTGTLRRALEDEGKLGKAMAEGKLEKAMAKNNPGRMHAVHWRLCAGQATPARPTGPMSGQAEKAVHLMPLPLHAIHMNLYGLGPRTL